MNGSVKNVGMDVVPEASSSGSELCLPVMAINALYQKRTELVDKVKYHQDEVARIREALDQLDQTLQLFLPADPRTPEAVSGSHYLRYAEMRHRCLDAMRDGETIKAEVVVVALMRDKCLDPANHRRLRSDLLKRALRALDALHRIGRVAKIGHGYDVHWRLAEPEPAHAAGRTLLMLANEDSARVVQKDQIYLPGLAIAAAARKPAANRRR